MKDKKTAVAITVVAILLAIIIVQQTKIYSMELDSKRDYAKHALSTMEFIRDDMSLIIKEYETNSLEDYELILHNERIASYIVSIQSHEPKVFMGNLKKLRELATYDLDSYNDSAYMQYIKVVGFLDYTYIKVQESDSKDMLLDYYKAFSDEEFTLRLNEIIEEAG